MTRGAGKDHRYRYYFCSGKGRDGSVTCAGQWSSMAKIDSAVVETFISRILEPMRLMEVVRQLEMKVRQRERTGANGKRELEKELRRSQSEVDKLITAVARGVLTDDDARKQISMRKAEISDIRDKIGDTQSKSLAALSLVTEAKIKRFADGLATLLREGDIKFRQAYLRLFIRQIEVKQGELVMTGPLDARAGAAANPAKLPASSSSRFYDEWRPRRDLNSRPPD